MLVVLPAPFTPQIMNTVGPLAAMFNGASSWAINCLRFDLITSIASWRWITRGAELRADIGGDLAGRLRAHVGANQIAAQLFQERIIDQPTFAFEQVANVGLQELRGFFEALLEAREEAAASGGGF